MPKPTPPLTSLTVQQLKGPFDAIVAGSNNIVAIAPNTTNGNQFKCTGRELLFVNNTTGSPLTITITSAPDAFGRVTDIDEYSCPADTLVIFSVGLTNAKGWKQTDGFIYFRVTGTGGKIAVVRLPE